MSFTVCYQCGWTSYLFYLVYYTANATTFPPHKCLKIGISSVAITDVTGNWLLIYLIEKYAGYGEFAEFVREIEGILKSQSERVGFEPTRPLRAHMFSRHAVSATHAPLHPISIFYSSDNQASETPPYYDNVF